MTVTGVTHGIGELARLTGVPVRTIRYYSDEGLLPAVRSSGGHRRFTPETAEALRLIRRLRGLGLGLPAIAQVLRGERALAEAVSAERRALDVELSALAWRRASLRAVEEADPADRAARLDLLASVEHGDAARQAVAASMRRLFIVPVPESQREGFIALAAPDPPADPTPRQVVAYAELVALTGNGPLIPKLRARGEVNRAEYRTRARSWRA
ncbi:MerR family transcriptional regulator [Spirillospora sp. CA-294931]|uniref:MerR family transcriptional regulator n=1 Tax=Spirillospora sp. CA-294931 TaxID=3240042 RepID=UPI003D8DEC5B